MTKLTFNDLGLKEGLLKAITDLGFTTPSDIQAEAIPVALNLSLIHIYLLYIHTFIYNYKIAFTIININ